jgi:hypothetical protein
MSASLLVPKSREDLAIHRRCFERLARNSVGMMGRTPDYVNVTLAGYVGRSDVLRVVLGRACVRKPGRRFGEGQGQES